MAQVQLSDDEKAIFKRLEVGAVVLFGSRAQGSASQSSDFDFGVILENKSVLKSQKQRSRLYDAIYDLFSSNIKQLINIDIVFLDDAPYELRAHVMKYGQVVFEERRGIFADFKAATMIMYSDFAPLRKIFQDGVLAQIGS